MLNQCCSVYIFCFQWRELNKDDKNRYEEKAKKLAEENAAKQAEAERAFNDSLSMFPPSGKYWPWV